MTAVDDLIMMINERAEALRREKSAHPHGAFSLAEFFVYRLVFQPGRTP